MRETFEESGILLARGKDGGGGGGEGNEMLELSEEELEEGRREVFGDRVKFTAWLEGKGGVADTGEFRLYFLSSALVFGHDGMKKRGTEKLTKDRKPHPLHPLDHAPKPAQTVHHANVPVHASPEHHHRRITDYNGGPNPYPRWRRRTHRRTV